jgi:hypothetical protein
MLQRTALTLLLVTTCAICLALVLNRNPLPHETPAGSLMASTGEGGGPPA